jgi:hypothetical protein
LLLAPDGIVGPPRIFRCSLELIRAFTCWLGLLVDLVPLPPEREVYLVALLWPLLLTVLRECAMVQFWVI